MKYAFIAQHRREFRVKSMCTALGVSRSGYYEWRDRQPSPRARENARLLEKIREIHQQSREAYGADKTWQALRRRGESCGRHRVARLRQVHGIVAKRVRLFERTSTHRQEAPPAPDRLGRDFRASHPNRIWVTDMTFVPTRRGWLHLAVVLDLFSRRVVGWSMGSRPDQRVALDALQMAIAERRPAPGLIHHSDQGRLYASGAYRAMLRAHGMVQSMSRKGNCLDNAVAESFFSHLKNEVLHHEIYEDRDQARSAIFDYVAVFYNRQRLHQTLGYLSPVDFEAAVTVS
jgi:putative transposase